MRPIVIFDTSYLLTLLYSLDQLRIYLFPAGASSN